MEGGWRVVDVWESQQAFETFFNSKLKKALQEVQDFIGVWNLEGTQKVGTRTEAWKEKTNWSWKFDKDAAWITVESVEPASFTSWTSISMAAYP